MLNGTNITLAMMERLAGHSIATIPIRTRRPIESKRIRVMATGTRNKKCESCGHKNKKCTCKQ